MSIASSHDAKEAIKRAVDIVDLVGDYLPLRRQGKRFVGLCPWHEDSRPSLQVTPERQSYRCFVCNEGGDVFSFLMKMESLTFPEALAMLSERTGISLGNSGGKAEPGQRSEKDLLLRALRWAEELYHHCLLNDPAAEIARRYLAERGINDDSVKRFHLGFAPNQWDWLLDRAQAKNVPVDVLQRAGLVSPRSNSPGHYERFKGRLLFSIRDPQGRPVGFGGRVLPGLETGSPAKYVNSPETPLFSKSTLLYGLDQARDSVSRSRSCIVVEGYTDCIVAHQLGLRNVVAVLGTALGPRHMSLLRRYADRITLVLDGDEAGRRRASEILELFVAQPVDLRILTLPDEADPCDYLLAHGAEPFGKLADGAVDALEHKFRTVTEGVDAESTHDVQKAVESIVATLAKAPRLPHMDVSAARIKEDQILHRISRRFGLSEERLRERLSQLRRAPRKGEPNLLHGSRNAPGQTQTVAVPAWEQEVLELLLLEPGVLAALRDVISAEQFASPPHAAVFVACCTLSNRGQEPTLDRLLLELDDPDLKRLLVDVDEAAVAKGIAEVDSRLRAVLALVRRRQAEAEYRGDAAALKQTQGDETAGVELFQKIVQSQRNRQSIPAPTDG